MALHFMHFYVYLWKTHTMLIALQDYVLLELRHACSCKTCKIDLHIFAQQNLASVLARVLKQPVQLARSRNILQPLTHTWMVLHVCFAWELKG